jgi:hypothetical protein
MPCRNQNNTIDVDAVLTFFYKMVLSPGQNIETVSNSNGASVSISWQRTFDVSLQREQGVALAPNPIIQIGGDYTVDNDGNQTGCNFDAEQEHRAGLSVGEYAALVISEIHQNEVDRIFNSWFRQGINSPIRYVREAKGAQEIRDYGLLVAIRGSGNNTYRDSWTRLQNLKWEIKVPVHWVLRRRTVCCNDCGDNYYTQSFRTDFVRSEIVDEGNGLDYTNYLEGWIAPSDREDISLED